MDCTTCNIPSTLKQDHTVNRNCLNDVSNDDYCNMRINRATSRNSNQIEPGEDKQSPSMEITATMVVNKGKRTKRQRLSSPSHIPSLTYIHQEDHLEDDQEQLDLANCLILLAQGRSRPSSSSSSRPPRNPLGLFNKLSGNKRRSYSSSSLNLAGIYECKTCNRTFSSFQALGGHRASHRKLNIPTSTIINPDPISVSYPLTLQLGNINYSKAIHTTSTVAVQSNKIHECTICGAEFSSGQALGGHMRRHRGPVAPLNASAASNNTTNTNLSLSTAIDIKSIGKVDQGYSYNGVMSLDLNMPASPSPEDTEYSLRPKQQSAAMPLFSTTPALVDCLN